ncbi:MAG: glycosyltransferase family 2 protein [Candidatus Micrarchaeota archaeon]
MLKVSIIASMYNESEYAPVFFKEMAWARKQLDKKLGKTEIVIVDNGSTDQTPKLCDKLGKKYKVRIVHAPKPSEGKGNGISLGIKASRGEILVLLDSDGQQDPRDVVRIAEKLDDLKPEGYGGVIGWRFRKVGYTKTRNFLSFWWNLLNKTLFGIDIHDFGAQPRAFLRKAVEGYEIKSKRWLIEVELPFEAKKRGFNITDEPVSHRVRGGGVSKIRLDNVPQIFFDLLALRFSK